MVVKPLDFIARGPKGLVQPAIKCRGREYLRIIYGPEYTADDQLPRLRSRGLSGKRSLAAREFSLGIEALERFVAREPLRRVHECVFGVLALESEPVDPGMFFTRRRRYNPLIRLHPFDPLLQGFEKRRRRPWKGSVFRSTSNARSHTQGQLR